MAACRDPGVLPSMDIRSQSEKAKYRPYYYFANQFSKAQKPNFYFMVNHGTFNTAPYISQSLKFCETC